MQAGKLNKRITIQEYSEASNSIGEPIKSWSDVATVWAGFKTLKGSEKFRNEQVLADVSASIIIRYRDDVTSKQRIIFGSNTYEILSVINPEMANKMLLIDCKETL